MKIPSVLRHFFRPRADIGIEEKTEEEIRISSKEKTPDRENLQLELETPHPNFADKKWLAALAALLILIALAFILLRPPTPEDESPKVAGTEVVAQLPEMNKRTYTTETWVLKEDFLDMITRENTVIPWPIVEKIESILSWSVGLRNLLKGDTIILVQEQVPSKDPFDHSWQNERIMALSLHSSAMDTIVQAFLFDRSGRTQFFDQEGVPWERMFLKSPVKYSRVSSRYNLVRMHPLLKKIKPHYGNDFAAPAGEEILALADGKIVEQSTTIGNGNYVKIQHDSIYTTAYLHMSRFKPGQRVDDRVRQGDVIGYVGQTGSATGPHVCLRFWRRNYQDDFIKAFPYLPKPAPLPRKERSDFFQQRDAILKLIRTATI